MSSSLHIPDYSKWRAENSSNIEQATEVKKNQYGSSYDRNSTVMELKTKERQDGGKRRQHDKVIGKVCPV